MNAIAVDHEVPVKTIRTLLVSALVAMTAAAFPAVAQETWPARPVTVIVPFPAGQGVDAMARALAGELARITAQPFAVVNREGAAATIGFAAMVRSKPDGYTIAIAPNTPLTIAPHLLKSVPYGFDAAIPVCQSFENVMAVFVGPQSTYRTLRELLDAAPVRAGSATWGSSGIGSVPHLSAAGLLQAAKVTATHVPFRGEPQILQQLLVNEITFAAASVSGMSGRNVRALAVFAAERHPAYPDVPSLGELGLPPGVPGLNGVFVPAGTPDAIVTTLERACSEATASEGFRAFAGKLHQRVAYLGRRDFERRLRADFDEKAALIKSLDIRPE